MRRATLAVILLAFTGCSLPEQKQYSVKFVRPDGQTQKTIVVSSLFPPQLISHEGAVALQCIGDRDYHVPSGWMVEVDPVAEEMPK